jgi:phosphatidylglycerophosphatase A
MFSFVSFIFVCFVFSYSLLLREASTLNLRQVRGRALKINGLTELLAIFIATGFGSGFIPVSPGTVGSLVGLGIAYCLISILSLDVVVLQNSMIAVSLVLAALGIWSSNRAEDIFEQKDPGQIVVDEVCGQVITFVFVAPYLVRLGPQWRWWMIGGFALFRLFDIFKPFPLAHLERLSGGLGVMMDDIVAGIYAAVILSITLMFVTS